MKPRRSDWNPATAEKVRVLTMADSAIISQHSELGRFPAQQDWIADVQTLLDTKCAWGALRVAKCPAPEDIPDRCIARVLSAWVSMLKAWAGESFLSAVFLEFVDFFAASSLVFGCW